jgi:hypothetical protein
MKSIDGRLSKLERRLGIAHSGPRFLVILIEGEVGSSQDAYIKILSEAGFLPAAGVRIVDFNVIPRGLNAKEEERFVRENGARICGSRLVPSTNGPGMEGDDSIQRQPRSGPRGNNIEVNDIELAESFEIKL